MENPQERHETITVIVNGRQMEVATKELSFDQVVHLAFENPPSGPNVVFTVTYRKGEGDKAGTLAPGESVRVRDGMIVSVTATDKS